MNHGIVMKGLLSLLGGLAFLSAAYGQGQVNFANTSSTSVLTNSTVGGLPSGTIFGPPGSYYFALFIAPSGTVDRASFAFTDAYGTNTATAGRFNGGQPGLSGYSPGTTVSLLVRGWSANVGSQYSDVVNYLANPTFDAWYGESQIAILILGGGGTPVPNLFGTFQGGGLNQIPGFTLEMHAIPEPSSAALAGLGLAAMWLLRLRSRGD